MSSPENASAATADIGVVGLAVMGSNLARNFARHGHTVALFNRSAGRTRDMTTAHGAEGSFVPSETVRRRRPRLRRAARTLRPLWVAILARKPR